ncbi:MAG: hypothetical protein RI900_3248 [Actinomycetota bacterium]|jgi:hypothetical protein
MQDSSPSAVPELSMNGPNLDRQKCPYSLLHTVDNSAECPLAHQPSMPSTAALRYLSDRNNRQDTPNQMAIAASQTAAVRKVLPLDDAP